MIPHKTLLTGALRLLERQTQKAPITTGIGRLDDFIFGWLPSTLSVIEGELELRQPAALLRQVAVFHALAGVPVSYFSLETTVQSTLEQMLEVVAGGSFRELDPKGVEAGREVARIGVRQRLEEAVARVAAAPLFMNDRYELTPVEIIEQCRALLDSHGRCIAFVDSVHGLSAVNSDGVPRHWGTLRILAEGAKRFQLPVVVSARAGAITGAELEHVDVLIRLTVDELEDGLGPHSPDAHEPRWHAEATFDVVRNLIGECGKFGVPFEPGCHRFDGARAPWE